MNNKLPTFYIYRETNSFVRINFQSDVINRPDLSLILKSFKIFETVPHSTQKPPFRRVPRGSRRGRSMEKQNLTGWIYYFLRVVNFIGGEGKKSEAHNAINNPR